MANTSSAESALGGREPLSLALTLGWAVGTFSMATIYSASSVLLLGYLVNNVGLAAGTAGLLFGASKLYDAIVDPIIGVVSDRTRSRWGRRRPFILAGTLVSALTFWLLFRLPVNLSPGMLTTVTAVALLANATGYALFVIPYLAMPAEMTTDPTQRTRLMAYRVGATSLGQVMGSFVAPLLIASFGGGLPGHAVMGGVLAFIVLLTGLACFFATAKAKYTDRVEGHSMGVVAQFRTAFQNHHFAILMGVKMTSLLYVAVSTVITPFLFTQILHQSYKVLGYFFLAKSIAMLVTQPLWVKLTARYGRYAAYYIGAVGLAVTTLPWLLCTPETPLTTILGLGVANGLASGGMLLIGQALLPDAIGQDFRRTGLRREGVFAGVYTVVERASFALAASMTGIVLGAMGYVASKGGPVAQPPSAILGIYLCLGGSLVFVALSAFCLHFYPRDAAKPEAVPGNTVKA
ncbi:MAG: MFS transporter [Azospirillaceae bacterium]|nr:MFS transporter [Azospirillaceae bacterium]